MGFFLNCCERSHPGPEYDTDHVDQGERVLLAQANLWIVDPSCLRLRFIFRLGVDSALASEGLVKKSSNLANAPRILLSLLANSCESFLAILPSISWET